MPATLDPIIFSHANGFPAKTYSYLFELLKPYPIQCINKFGHGNYCITKDWLPLAHELIDFTKTFTPPLVGIGHSMGGVASLYATSLNNKLFHKIIMLDPPLIAGSYRKHLIQFSKLTGLIGNLLPIARKTKSRRIGFSSKTEAWQYFKTKKLFSQFHSQCLSDYIEHGLVYNLKTKQYELDFSAKIEYDIYCAFPHAYPFKIYADIPIYLVYSKEVLSKADLNWYKKHFSNIELIPFKGGHLFPFEEPQKTATLIKSLVA